MATRNADVNLIVRARTEGEKAIAGLSGILNDLFDDARGGSADIADLGKTLGALDKAASAIAGSMGEAGSAIDRQRASLSENNAAYAALLRQQAEAQRVLASFGDQSNKDFVGPRTKAFTQQYEGVRAEVDRLGSAISMLFAKIGQQNTQLNGTQSALLNLSATSTAVAQGQAQAEAQIELTSQALREQAAAAERVTEIQQRINALTGVDRPTSAAPDLDLLAAADAEYRRKEAAEAEAIALRQVNNQLAERARLEATLERTTGIGRVSARDAGASFSALDARERDAEQRDREAKAERDLAEATRVTNSALAERARLEATLERTTGIGRARAVDSGATISALTELVNKEHAAAEASDQMDKEVAQLRATLDPLAAIQDRFNTSLARYRLLAREGKLGTDELAAAERHLTEEADRARAALAGADGANGRGGNGKIGLFGLKPYELQNLSYQVNDVVTQLASGTSLTQTLSQQGGQILQLFPRVAGSLIGALRDPRILLLVGTVIAIGAGLKEAANQAQRLREYSGQTTFRADGGSYNPKTLADAEDRLERIGAKAKDAEAAVKVFLNEGINPDLLTQFSRVAQETAEVLGTDLPTAAKQVAEAFTGGFKAVADLDDKLNFLSASEREHIRDLFESGNAEAARTEALNIYSRQMSAAASLMRGPWTDAARSLGTAWDALIKYIADSLPIRATIVVLNELAGVVKDVGDAITGALGDDKPKAGAGSAAANIAAVQAQIAKLKKEIADYETAIEKKSPISGTLQRLVDQSKRQLAEAQSQLASLEKNAPDTLNGDPNSTAAKRRAERLADIDGEREIQRLRQKGASGLNALDSARRVQQAGEIAYRQEMEATGDAIVAARLREIAITKEQGEVDKQNEAARKAARAEREREIRQFQSRVVGAEGGTAQNPFSTAKGYGQFTNSTFLNQFQKVFPDRGASLPRDQILALRQNEQVARAIIDNYSRENARFLESFGAKVTAGNLYLAHFLGAGGAKAILTAPGSKPVDQIIQKLPRAADILSGNQGYLRTNGGKGRYRTADELESFIANRVGDTGAAQSQGQVEINNLIEDSRRKQDAFNLAIRQGNENREAAIGSLRNEIGLSGEALLAEQRRQAVAEAERDIRQQVEDANKNLKPGEAAIVVTQEQIDKAKELAGALFDVQNARAALDARYDAVQRPLDILEDQRDLLIEQRDLLQSMGDFEAAGQIQSEIESLSGSIQTAYDKVIEFYRALSPAERVSLGILDSAQLDVIIRKLEIARDRSKEWGRVAGISGEQIAQSFSASLVNSVTNFINKIAAGKNVFRSLIDGIREFAATFISSIAQMILQLLAYAAAVSILRALGVPVPTTGVGVHHAGGIAGSAGGVKRSVSPMLFSNAMRYHTGGIAGLAPDEVPAVLKRNEEVLTEGDPRHRFNGGLEAGREGGQPMSVKNVNLFDLDSLAQAMMSTKVGEKVILNIIKANGRAVKAALS